MIAGSEAYIPSMPVLADALETAEANLSLFFRIRTSAKSSQCTLAYFILVGDGIKNYLPPVVYCTNFI